MRRNGRSETPVMGAVSTRPGIVTSPIFRGFSTGGEYSRPPQLVEIIPRNCQRAAKTTSRTLSPASGASVRLVATAVGILLYSGRLFFSASGQAVDAARAADFG